MEIDFINPLRKKIYDTCLIYQYYLLDSHDKFFFEYTTSSMYFRKIKKTKILIIWILSHISNIAYQKQCTLCFFIQKNKNNLYDWTKKIKKLKNRMNTIFFNTPILNCRISTKPLIAEYPDVLNETMIH